MKQLPALEVTPGLMGRARRCDIGVIQDLTAKVNVKPSFLCWGFFYAKGLMIYLGKKDPSEQVGQTSAERLWLNVSISLAKFYLWLPLLLFDLTAFAAVPQGGTCGFPALQSPD